MLVQTRGRGCMHAGSRSSSGGSRRPGQSSAAPAAVATSGGGGGRRAALVCTGAFKRSSSGTPPPNRQPGSSGPAAPTYPLPPLEPREAAAATPRMPSPPPNNGGGGYYQQGPPGGRQGGQQQQQQRQQWRPPAPQQRPPGGAPQGGAAAAPPQQVPLVTPPMQQPPPSQTQSAPTPPPQQFQQPPPQQQAPPKQPRQGGYQQQPGGYQQQQGGYTNPPPGQQQQQQPGGGFHQQGGYINAPPGQQQQQGGFINRAATAPPSAPYGAPPAGGAAGYPPPAQQQQQQPLGGGDGFDPEQGGYLTDAGNYIGQGGYINTQQQGGGWQGGYVQSPPRRQSSYSNDRWNDQGGRNNNAFTGFSDSAWGNGDGNTDFLLQTLSNWAGDSPNTLDDWAEVEEEEPVDDSPKYVNGKRVLVNTEIADSGVSRVRVQGGAKEDMGVMTLDEAQEAARELARAMTEQSLNLATAQLAARPRDDAAQPMGAVRKSVRARVDVVLINGDADPPVVRLVDFSKFKYDAEKTAKQKQKASKGTETKEVRLRPVTEKADYQTKVKAAQKFLSKGSKVKLTMTFSGREMRFKDQGKEMMLQLIEELAPVSKMDAPLSLRPSNFSVTLSPLK